MKILLVVALILLAALIPGLSYSEQSYALEGKGYGIINNAVQAISLKISMKSAIDEKPMFDSGTVLLGSKTYSLKGADLSLSNKQIALNANAGSFTINTSGKSVSSAGEIPIYQLSGSTSDGSKFSIFAKLIREQSAPAILETPKKDLLVLVKQSDRVQWKDQYKFTVRAFDPKLNPGSDFFGNTGYLDGVQIYITVINPIGQVLKSFNGVTQKSGYYDDSVIMPDNARTGIYKLNVTASGKDFKTISKEFTFTVIPQ